MHTLEFFFELLYYTMTLSSTFECNQNHSWLFINDLMFLFNDRGQRQKCLAKYMLSSFD